MAPKKPAPARAPRPSALVRAEHGGTEVSLTAAQRAVLAEVLREGEDFREEVESAVLRYGRSLLDKVFGGDTSAALDANSKNPVWQELVRRAGGPTLSVSRHMLYTSLRIAANDKRITDRAWRGLDVGRKELLLPLGTDGRLRDAARHVSELNLSQAKTREYVSSVLADAGRPKRARLTSSAFAARVRSAHAALASHEVLRKVRDLEFDDGTRTKMLRELSELREAVAELVKAVRRR